MQQNRPESALLAIVHPYTYKLNEGEPLVGPQEQYASRDQAVGKLVARALCGGRAVHYQGHVPDSLWESVFKTAFTSDPSYRFIHDPRLERTVLKGDGLPLLEEHKYELDERTWRTMRDNFAGHEDLRARMEDAEHVIFIGGALEACVANLSMYTAEHISPDTQRLSYVPELCAVFNEQERARMEPRMQETGIRPLDYEQACAMFVTECSATREAPTYKT